ncbi:phosphoribosylglycinamide formyltransferase [Marinoscillum furvescens]|uniref:Phosphoribosylglycinamide formyltransferase n=1 Tax=Marinoscillum furvescens DSM 4134 TaxID=1122208 RepID=A0A3D9L698_MARFU|nr:phosphoribosylglycinamide formyltransferase [Marinoscillum furvescens]REE01700.1 formyltetrahydrofolate-dependent phosphoribosylglycinamide formyltransferase [Marinoscillum furvescens DSM 4134]
MSDRNIVVFASGSGSNAEQLIKHFEAVEDISVSAVFCNKPNAYVLERAKKLGVPSEVFDRSSFHDEQFLNRLQKFEADFIVLAGFLWKVPEYLIGAFPDKIINIHPALLPSYGGKGMYGQHVHEAVIANKEPFSGITIHLVNENYDEGRTLFQAKVAVGAEDTPDSLAQKIHQLEHQHFPVVVEDYIRGLR